MKKWMLLSFLLLGKNIFTFDFKSLAISYGKSLDAAVNNIEKILGIKKTILIVYGSAAVLSLVRAYKDYGGPRNLSELLCYCASSENIGMLKILLKLGVDKNAKYHGNTALHLAAERGSIEVVKILLSAGVDLNAKNSVGSSALHSAFCGEGITEKNIEVAKLLLTAGVNKDDKDKFGSVALHYAVKQDNVEAVKMLLVFNADYRVENKYSLLPVDFALDLFVREILQSKDPYNHSAVLDVVRSNVIKSLGNLNKAVIFAEAGLKRPKDKRMLSL